MSRSLVLASGVSTSLSWHLVFFFFFGLTVLKVLEEVQYRDAVLVREEFWVGL